MIRQTRQLAIIALAMVAVVTFGALAIVFVLHSAIAAEDKPQGKIVMDPAARAVVLSRARAVMTLVKAGDSQSLFDRFNPSMAAAVPEAQVSGMLKPALAQSPIGACLGESARDGGQGNSIYMADYAWNGSQLAVTIDFDPDGKIAQMLLDPNHPLPPDPMATYVTKGIYRLPFRGTWFVFWGGNTEADNYHVDYPDQRHAYDIVVARGGSTHRGTGDANDDYYDWGTTIVAPANATVVEAVDGIANNKPGVMNSEQPAGNHVILDCGNGEYLVMAHFKDYSLRVRRGDKVTAGQPIAECGNSGNSSEPHLHIHLQDGPRLMHATGLPLAFSKISVDGKLMARAQPVQGQFIHAD